MQTPIGILQKQMTSRQFSEYGIYMSHEPMGTDAVVIAIAQMASAMKMEPKNFMPDWWADKSEKGQWEKNEEIRRSFEQMAQRMKAKQNAIQDQN